MDWSTCMRCQLDGKREGLERVYRKGEEWRGWVGGARMKWEE